VVEFDLFDTFGHWICCLRRWSRKTARRVAKGRNADLRDYYLYKLSFYRSYQLVYIDESGCDRRVGRRRFG
jgi:hypothetical protein